MTTQPKKPAKRPIRYRAGVPQITRKFLYLADAAMPTDAEIRAKAREAVANDMSSTRILFSCKGYAAEENAVKAGTLNPIADVRLHWLSTSQFVYFFCASRPSYAFR